jgi:hypothetical protein
LDERRVVAPAGWGPTSRRTSMPVATHGLIGERESRITGRCKLGIQSRALAGALAGHGLSPDGGVIMLPSPPLSLTEPVSLSRIRLPHLSPHRPTPTEARLNSPETCSPPPQVPENVSPCQRVPSSPLRSGIFLHSLRLRHLLSSPIV